MNNNEKQNTFSEPKSYCCGSKFVIPLFVSLTAILVAISQCQLAFETQYRYDWTVKNIKEDGDGKTYAYNMWRGVYQLYKDGAGALAFVVFIWSGIFPYVKLILITLIDKRSHSTTKVSRKWSILSTLSKWSFLDVWIVAITVLCVRIHIVKDQTLLNIGFYKETFKLIIWTQAVALPGVYYFSMALIFSQILGHIVLHRSLAHPEAQLTPWYDDQASIDQLSKEERAKIKSVMTKSSTLSSTTTTNNNITNNRNNNSIVCTTFITILCFTSFFMLLAGVMLPFIHIEFDFSLRIHKWMLDENIEIHKISETYNIINGMFAMGTANHIGSENVGMAIFLFIFVILAPLARSFCSIILWFIPMSPNVQKTWAGAIDIFSIFAGADVFAITVFLMIWQLPHLFENMEEAAKYVTLKLTAYNGLYFLTIGGFLDTFISPLIYHRYCDMVNEDRLKDIESSIPFAKVSGVPVDYVEEEGL